MVIEVRKIGWDGFAAKREKREKRGGRRGFYFQEGFFFLFTIGTPTLLSAHPFLEGSF